MENKPSHKFNRRDFMKTVIFAIGGVIGAAVGVPAIEYIIGPSFKKGTENWIELGATNKVELNTPTLFKANVTNQTGWVSSQEEISVYILTDDGQNYLALSNVCTHLGCRVRWIAEKGEFACPCHNGVFAKDGTVVSGPPPRPLNQYPTKVENGMLYILRG